jgi:hypothetical protein
MKKAAQNLSPLSPGNSPLCLRFLSKTRADITTSNFPYASQGYQSNCLQPMGKIFYFSTAFAFYFLSLPIMNFIQLPTYKNLP